MDYDAWGNVTNLVDPSCSQGGTALCWVPFGFAGGVWDVVTRVVRLRARDYDPAMRRWAQKDPIGFAGGQENLYAYAGDEPINGSERIRGAVTQCSAATTPAPPDKTA